jgi:rhamnogalacturonan hydrolase
MKFLHGLFGGFTLAELLFGSCSAQLAGSVGPTTSTASKAAKKICNVLDYGAKADMSTDIGPPLLAAFEACSTGGIGE